MIRRIRDFRQIKIRWFGFAIAGVGGFFTGVEKPMVFKVKNSIFCVFFGFMNFYG